MEAWLNAHALNPVKRPVWVPDMVEEQPSQPKRESGSRRGRNPEALRRQLRDLIEGLGPRELDQLAAFGDFLRTRRAAKRSSQPDSPPTDRSGGTDPAPSAASSDDGEETPSSGQVSRRKAAASD